MAGGKKRRRVAVAEPVVSQGTGSPSAGSEVCIAALQGRPYFQKPLSGSLKSVSGCPRKSYICFSVCKAFQIFGLFLSFCYFEVSLSIESNLVSTLAGHSTCVNLLLNIGLHKSYKGLIFISENAWASWTCASRHISQIL